jgi:hypothetical protein
MHGSEAARDKLRGREGNNPDHRLRSPNNCSQGKDVPLPRQPGCWLRSSHSFKECVIAHWSSDGAPTILGTKQFTEAVGPAMGGRGAFHYRRSITVRLCGGDGRAYVGMSSDNGGENPPRRKSKVSGAPFVDSGLGGP